MAGIEYGTPVLQMMIFLLTEHRTGRGKKPGTILYIAALSFPSLCLRAPQTTTLHISPRLCTTCQSPTASTRQHPLQPPVRCHLRRRLHPSLTPCLSRRSRISGRVPHPVLTVHPSSPLVTPTALTPTTVPPGVPHFRAPHLMLQGFQSHNFLLSIRTHHKINQRPTHSKHKISKQDVKFFYNQPLHCNIPPPITYIYVTSLIINFLPLELHSTFPVCCSHYTFTKLAIYLR